MPSKSSDTRLESSKVPSFCFFKGGNLKKKKKKRQSRLEKVRCKCKQLKAVYPRYFSGPLFCPVKWESRTATSQLSFGSQIICIGATASWYFYKLNKAKFYLEKLKNKKVIQRFNLTLKIVGITLGLQINYQLSSLTVAYLLSVSLKNNFHWWFQQCILTPSPSTSSQYTNFHMCRC